MDDVQLYNNLIKRWRYISTNPVKVCDHYPIKPNCITCSTDLLNGILKGLPCHICNSMDKLIVEWDNDDNYKVICVDCYYNNLTNNIIYY